MGRLDVQRFRYLSPECMRVLTAVEMGMKNHAEVPEALIASVSGLKSVNFGALLRELTKQRLIRRSASNASTNSYHLTMSGYDYLALNALTKRGVLSGIGSRIGVGKEADVYLGENAEGQEVIIKFARLGRTSFHHVKQKRDYAVDRQVGNNLYLSRIAALKEFAFSSALYSAGFPVPRPIDVNRHVIVMERARGTLLQNVSELEDPSVPCGVFFSVLVRLARFGLIHGDFNEFNLFVDTESPSHVTVIDFPQMVTTSHPNARTYFSRDVECIRHFFESRFHLAVDRVPSWEGDACPEAVARWAEKVDPAILAQVRQLDLEIEQKGYHRGRVPEFEQIESMMLECAPGEEAGDGSDSESDPEELGHWEGEDAANDDWHIDIDVDISGTTSTPVAPQREPRKRQRRTRQQTPAQGGQLTPEQMKEIRRRVRANK